jgi:DegV family protein with EDD domain
VGGKTYRDWVDVSPSEAYKMFLADPDTFNTSPASPIDCLEVFRKASQRAKNILCITVSIKLSTMYNAACQARDLAKTELPDTTIEVLDSNSATPSEGMIALAAARVAAEGKDLQEVLKVAEEIRDKVNVIVFLDTIKHAYRSGRIPKIASKLGSILNIKPIFTVSGIVHFTGMARSRKTGIERLLHMMRKKVDNRPVRAAVMHAYAPDEAEKLKERVVQEFDCVELWVSEFSPVMGYACGTGTIGIAFYQDGQEGN